MATRTRVDSIERDITAIINRDLSPEAQSRALAGFAREQLAAAQAQNEQALGVVPPHATYVDGRQTEALETVRPDGRIVFEFELINDALAWIGKALVEGSPVKTGKFASSFLVLADGAIVPPGAPLPLAHEYTFVNSQPYARKIERGFSAQAPDGVFDVVAYLADRRFGNIVDIRFGYTVLKTGAIDEWAGSARGAAFARRHRRKRDASEWLRKQPSIIVRSY